MSKFSSFMALPTETHHGVWCDGCNASPIVGKRFKCVDCADYDYCQNCIINKTHFLEHRWKIISSTPHVMFDSSGVNLGNLSSQENNQALFR